MPLWLLTILAAAPTLGPLTVRDGVAPVQVVDSADFRCNTHSRFHLELIELETGTTSATLTGWSDVLGELEDGALVVTNETVPSAKNLQVAVLERTGAVRFSCAVDFNPGAFEFRWSQTESGLQGTAKKVFVQTGVMREPDPANFVVHRFGLSLEKDSCSLAVKKKGERGTAVPGPKLSVKGVISSRVSGEYIQVVAAKGWKRRTAFVPVLCKIP